MRWNGQLLGLKQVNAMFYLRCLPMKWQKVTLCCAYMRGWMSSEFVYVAFLQDVSPSFFLLHIAWQSSPPARVASPHAPATVRLWSNRVSRPARLGTLWGEKQLIWGRTTVLTRRAAVQHASWNPICRKAQLTLVVTLIRQK